MRRALAAVVLVGCNFARPLTYGTCSTDADCSHGDVCARTGDCLAATELAPPITLAWTFHGAPADATWCAQYPRADLLLTSSDGNPDLIVRDLPCSPDGIVLDRIPRDLPFFALGIAGTPIPSRFPNPNWDSRYVAPGSARVTFALEP